jgi:hypothetical protein
MSGAFEMCGPARRAEVNLRPALIFRIAQRKYPLKSHCESLPNYTRAAAALNRFTRTRAELIANNQVNQVFTTVPPQRHGGRR